MDGLCPARALPALARAQCTGTRATRPIEVSRVAILAFPYSRSWFSCASHSVLIELMRKKLEHDTPYSPHDVSYIWFGVPSDHTPVGTTNRSIGSGLPRNCGVRNMGEFGNLNETWFESSIGFAPHTEPSMSGV